jgi:hypothetical protein
MTDYEIRWSEMGIPSEEEHRDSQWLDSPLHRKLMGLLYLFVEIFQIIILSALIGVATVLSFQLIPRLSVSFGVNLSIALSVGLAIIAIDLTVSRYRNSPIFLISLKLGYYTLRIAARVYIYIRYRRSPDLSATKEIPTRLLECTLFKIWQKENNKRRFQF